MKLTLLLGAATLARLAAGATVARSPLAPNSTLQDISFNLTAVADSSTKRDGPVRVAATADWASNVARGRKLMAAMKGTDAEAAAIWKMGETAQSAFDGDLKKEMRQWGWNDNTEKQQDAIAKQCDFAAYHKVRRSRLVHVEFPYLTRSPRSAAASRTSAWARSPRPPAGPTSASTRSTGTVRR